MPTNIAKMKIGDRVVVYNNAGYPHLDGVPTYAEAIQGLGFTGHRWVSAADRLKDLPDDWYPAVMPKRTVHALQDHAPLVVFDVDSTLIHEEVIELLAAHAGKEQEVAEVTERAMRGEIDFADSLHYRVATLEGLPVSVLDEVAAAATIHEGIPELVSAVQRAGGYVYAVSGGFTHALAPLAAQLGLNGYAANTLEIVDGKLTGKVTGQVIDRAAKAAMLRQWAAAHQVPLDATIAVGDGANDIDMLELAGYGVGFCPKPVVRQHADCIIEIPTHDVLRAVLGL
jgi:phosphoserine phosphatase